MNVTRAAAFSLLPCALLACAACSGPEEPPPVANTYEETLGEIENRARIIEAEAENNVTAQEQLLENEADLLRQQADANPVNAAEQSGVD